jgi:two-component system, OmpR family, response regulator MtrA
MKTSQTASTAAPGTNGTGRAPFPPLARLTLLVGLEDSAPSFLTGFQEEGTQTLVAEGSADALDAAKRLGPDLVVLQSPESTTTRCLELVRDLRADRGVGRILVLLPAPVAGSAIACLEAGADDVVLPPYTVETVILRARLAAERRALLGSDLEPARRLRVEGNGERVLDHEGSIALTARETELLARLLQADGTAVSREQLLEDIWGSSQRSVAVLDATVHRLRRKLEANPANPKILTTVRGVGYRLEMARLEMI